MRRSDGYRPPMEPDDLLMAADVARLAGVTSDTVRTWADRGVLPVHRTANGTRLFLRADVDVWLAARKSVAESRRC